jgi:hypothetical protein
MTADDTVTAKLAEWEALAEGATPGPWRAQTHIDFPYEPGYLVYRAPEDGGVFGTAGDVGWAGVVSDAEFIAAARHMVPALLAAVQGVLTLIDEDHCPGGCEHDAIDAEVLGDRIKRALMEQIGGEG